MCRSDAWNFVGKKSPWAIFPSPFCSSHGWIPGSPMTTVGRVPHLPTLDMWWEQERYSRVFIASPEWAGGLSSGYTPGVWIKMQTPGLCPRPAVPRCLGGAQDLGKQTRKAAQEIVGTCVHEVLFVMF